MANPQPEGVARAPVVAGKGAHCSPCSPQALLLDMWQRRRRTHQASVPGRRLTTAPLVLGRRPARNDDRVQAVQRGESYSWRGPATWACYRPDADILVPVYSRYGLDTVVPPLAGARNISLLMRFDYPVRMQSHSPPSQRLGPFPLLFKCPLAWQSASQGAGSKKDPRLPLQSMQQVGDGKSLVAHHGHRLRKELIDEWTARPLPGSELGLRSTAVSGRALSACRRCMRRRCRTAAP